MNSFGASTGFHPNYSQQQQHQQQQQQMMMVAQAQQQQQQQQSFQHHPPPIHDYQMEGMADTLTGTIFDTAATRWLNVTELIALLSVETTPLSITTPPPSTPPPSGTLILYDRNQTRNYKYDKYEWIKKKNSNKIREDHVKLRVGGVYRVAGCYVHHISTPTFHRRAYHLLDPSGSGKQLVPEMRMTQAGQQKAQSLVLVHYLDTHQAALISARLADKLASVAMNPSISLAVNSSAAAISTSMPVSMETPSVIHFNNATHHSVSSSNNGTSVASHNHSPSAGHQQYQRQSCNASDGNEFHLMQPQQQLQQQAQTSTQQLPSIKSSTSSAAQRAAKQRERQAKVAVSMATELQKQQQHENSHSQDFEPKQSQQQKTSKDVVNINLHDYLATKGLRLPSQVESSGPSSEEQEFNHGERSNDAGHHHKNNNSLAAFSELVDPGREIGFDDDDHGAFEEDEGDFEDFDDENFDAFGNEEEFDHDNEGGGGHDGDDFNYDDIAADVEDILQEEDFSEAQHHQYQPHQSVSSRTKGHRNKACASAMSLDADTMDILWNMVVEEGQETFPDGMDEIQEAAAAAIEAHLNPQMEAELVDTIEQAMAEHALMNAGMINTANISSSNEITLNSSSLSAPGATNAVGIVLQQNLHPVLEEKIMATLGESLEAGNNFSFDFGDTTRASQKTTKGFAFGERDHISAGGSVSSAASSPGGGVVSRAQVRQQQMAAKVGKRHGGKGNFGGGKLSAMKASLARSAAEKTGDPHSSFDETSKEPAPLPELVDFTPEQCLIPSTEEEAKNSKVVLSIASALPELSPEEPDGNRWVPYAVFVELVQPTTPQDTTTAKSFGKALDVTVRNCALSSPLKRLTPFSYKCSINLGVKHSGVRHILLLALRIHKSVLEPDLKTLNKALTIGLQGAYNSAFDSMISNIPGQPPKFFAPSLIGENIQLLSQQSLDTFEFFPKPNYTPLEIAISSMGRASVPCDSTSRSSTGPEPVLSTTTKVLPVNPPLMATVANAMMSFDAAPPEAVLRRKRVVREEELTSQNPPETAVGWLSMSSDRSSNYAPLTSHHSSGVDEIMADSVSRHCKVRFVERVANVIVGSATTAEAASSSSDPSRQDYLPIKKEGEQVILQPLAVNAQQITMVRLRDEFVSTNNSGGNDSGQQASTRNANGFELLNEEQVQQMDGEELDSLLDSLMIRMVEALVNSSSNDSELRNELNAPDKSGFTLIHYAALYNLLGLLPTLLAKGADPNVKTVCHSLTPLHLAAGAGNFALVESLVRHNCQIDSKDSYGLSPADHAVKNSFESIGSWLWQRLGFSQEEIDKCVAERKGENLQIGDDLAKSAFTNLSLKDKLALNFFAQKRKQHSGGGGSVKEDVSVASEATNMSLEERSAGAETSDSARRNSLSGAGRTLKRSSSDSKLDVRNVMSASDRESLDVAMSLMSQDEREDLEAASKYIDIRSWMLKSGYESMVEAHELSKRKGERASSFSNKDLTVQGAHQKMENASVASTSSSSAAKTNKLKLSQALASLVIRKKLLADERARTLRQQPLVRHVASSGAPTQK
jgi:ankyrin repeat protein